MEIRQMLTDEQAFSWEKAMNSTQQNGRKEMLTDEQTSSWKESNAPNSTEWKKGNAHGRKSF